MTPQVTRRYVATGRVQGVGFRHFVATAAGRLGLQGTVANRPDGSVEVVARGAPEHLDALRSCLEQGPRFAHVTNVETLEILDVIPLPSGFFIIR